MEFFGQDGSWSPLFSGNGECETQDFSFTETNVVGADVSGISGSPLIQSAFNQTHTQDMALHSDRLLAGRMDSSVSSGKENIFETNGKMHRITEKQSSTNPQSEKKRRNESNAAYAKQNREKKKLESEQMQAKLKQLTTRNLELETLNGELGLRVQALEQQVITERNLHILKTDKMNAHILQKDQENEELLAYVKTREQEIFYLKSVIANDSALAHVLSKLQSDGQVHLTTSFDRSKYSGGEHLLPSSGGVCLHVDGSKVSLEMCAKCAEMAVGAPQPV